MNEEATEPGGWTRARVVFLALSALGCVALLVWAADVLLPFIVALIVAYVLTPLVAACERARVPRSAAILLVYVVTLGGTYLIGAAIVPRLVHEVVAFSREAPAMARSAGEQWGPKIEGWVQGVMARPESHEAPPGPPPPAFEVVQRADGSLAVDVKGGVRVVPDGEGGYTITPAADERVGFSLAKVLSEGMDSALSYARHNALVLLRVGQAIVSGLSRAIFLTFMTLMVAGYLMYTRDDVLAFLRSLPPPAARPGFERLLARMDRGLSGVVRGQLLICLVNGALTAIGLWLFEVRYWPILSLVAGLMSLIPIFGAILSTVPCVLIALTQSFWTALWVLLWILGIHQIEANFLNPKIIGDAAKIHPVLVVFSLFVGEHYYGLWGALFAVPAMSLVLSVFHHFRYASMPDAPMDSLLPLSGRRR